MRTLRVLLGGVVFSLLAPAGAVTAAEASGPVVLAGAARVDITPELPIRLSGYQQRVDEAKQVVMPLHARALAIGADADTPVVLITAEVIAVSEALSDAVAARIRARHGLSRAQVAVAVTHQHTGPAIAGTIPFMASRDLPADEVARIERYTAALQEKLVEAGLAALAARKPSRLAWAEGKATFAVNRRKLADGKWAGYTAEPGGVVDHALPVLRVTDERGSVRAVLANYACHCTTLKGGDNFVHPDWAGDAAQRIEAAHAGAIGLISIGCGADSDPQPRGLAEVATHGRTVAAEVARLLAGPMRPLGAVTSARFSRLELPLARTVTRAELEARTQGKPNVAYAARQYLRLLDAGQPLPSVVPYPVQTWAFGSDLAMVFLAGEVVADYAVRLKREGVAGRVWTHAYVNHVPCYIPSRRILAEGGYEAELAMDYYGFPTRLAEDTEDRIIGAVRAQQPAFFPR